MDENTTRVMFSSRSDNWGTPRDIFDKLDSVFHFTLDPAASHSNHLCDKYYTEEDDGLAQSWSGECVYCNPPYSRRAGKSQAIAWVAKSLTEALHPGTRIVMLLPARTDTQYWQHAIFPHASFVLFYEGRIRFAGAKYGAPFPSAFVGFGAFPELYEPHSAMRSTLREMGTLLDFEERTRTYLHTARSHGTIHY